MLNLQEIMLIRKQGWIIDHDWQIWSCLFGEPILSYPFVCYWNGSHFSICSWPIDRSLLNKEWGILLLETINEMTKRYSPDVLDIWGPIPISLNTPLVLGYKKFSIGLSNDQNVNLQIRFEDYRANKSHKNRNYSNSFKAEKDGMYCKISKGNDFSWEQIFLLEHLMSNNKLDPLDKLYSALAPFLSNSENSTIFRAYKSGKLYGFIIVRELMSDVASIAWSCYEKNNLHTSDFLYRKVIEYYQNSGVSYLDMGYTVNKGLLEYKTRWNPNVNNGTYNNLVYIKNGLQFRNRFWSWWANALVAHDNILFY